MILSHLCWSYSIYNTNQQLNCLNLDTNSCLTSQCSSGSNLRNKLMQRVKITNLSSVVILRQSWSQSAQLTNVGLSPSYLFCWVIFWPKFPSFFSFRHFLASQISSIVGLSLQNWGRPWFSHLESTWLYFPPFNFCHLWAEWNTYGGHSTRQHCRLSICSYFGWHWKTSAAETSMLVYIQPQNKGSVS